MKEGPIRRGKRDRPLSWRGDFYRVKDAVRIRGVEARAAWQEGARQRGRTLEVWGGPRGGNTSRRR